MPDSKDVTQYFLKKIYYHLKPLIPRSFQIWFRSAIIRNKHHTFENRWPILEKAGDPPKGWTGWPEKKQFALVLTHDVETASGQEKCLELVRMEKRLGFRSSFNFVPERYKVLAELRHTLFKEGFEVGVHGLNHDGKLFSSQKRFQRRAAKINKYLMQWKAVGFRSPAMHHNLNWIHDLNIEYDTSTVDTDITELASDHLETIFPQWIDGNFRTNGYVELPVTLPQDFYLFILMKEKNIDIWIKKLDWIIEKQGMVLINVHPDYMNFNGRSNGIEQYPAQYYEKFLCYLKDRYKGMYYHPLPKQMARFWAARQTISC